MKTLFIVPHLDDEAISCGGLIRRRVAENGPDNVGVLVVYGRSYDYGRVEHDEEELEDFRSAQDVLGFGASWYFGHTEGEPGQVGYYKVLENIEGVLSKFQPDEVIIPPHDDLNQDHRFLNHVCMIALRPTNLGNVRRVLAFMGLDGQQKAANWFVQLTAHDLLTKVEAIGKYRRESRSDPSPRSPANVKAQARVWGSCSGHQYAEAYRLILERV